MKRSRAPEAGTALTVPLPGPDAAYFFDIDGTLMELAASPGAVRLDRQFHRVLQALARASGGAVALISGRSIADVDRLFPQVQWPVAGQHGLERRDAEGRISRPARPAADPLEDVRRRVAEVARRHPGLLVEDKGLSLALHYRGAPRLGGAVNRFMSALQARLGPGWCVQAGKRVVELKPAGADKGAAILAFVQAPPFRGRVPVFIGDDVTDEDGFAVVNRLGGLSVKVGKGRTVARWRLPDVRAVWTWLGRGPGSSPGTVA